MAAGRSVAGSCLVGLVGLVTGCTALVDLDRYEFVDGGSAATTPALPLAPGPDASAPAPPERPEPPAPPAPSPVASDAGADDAREPDAGQGPLEPPPAAPRPVVVVDAPEPLLDLAGNPAGGVPRSATCPGGVMYGVVFQYFTSSASAPDRLSYVWPLCTQLLPGTPALADGEAFEEVWLSSTPTDPVFAPLRDGEELDALFCEPGEYVVGIEGSLEPVNPSVAFRSLGVRCASLGTSAERSDVAHGAISSARFDVAPASAASAFAQQCPEGRAGSQLDLRFGNWLDAVGLGCSVVRWPLPAGGACASGPDCQSGSCSADGVCAP